MHNVYTLYCMLYILYNIIYIYSRPVYCVYFILYILAILDLDFGKVFLFKEQCTLHGSFVMFVFSWPKALPCRKMFCSAELKKKKKSWVQLSLFHQ